MENNRHDIFRLGVEPQDLITKPQFRHLPQKYMAAGKVLFNLGKIGLCRELLRMIRALLWNPEYKQTAFFSQSDLDLEIKVLKKYCEILRKQQKRFETSLEEDQRVMVTGGVRQYFAVIVRLLIGYLGKHLLRTKLKWVSMRSRLLKILNWLLMI